MTNGLKIASDFSLPLDAVTQTFAILAKRGSGKTHAASVMAEEMLAAGQQIVCLDPVGSMWGLQSKYPVVIFGGEHANVPLEDSSGGVIAQAIVEHGFSCVIDLSLFRKNQMIHFMVSFAEALYRLNRKPVHLFVDEADSFAPQAKNYGGEENRMLGAMEDIVRRGRKRGIGCTLISQRPACIHKSVLTQCEVLCALRLVHPRDIGAIKEWVNVHADVDTAKEMIESLPSLPTGTAWVWSPGWGNFFRKIQIRQRHTFDSGATPKPGEAMRAPKSLVEIDLNALGESIKATVEAAKEGDPKVLWAKLAEKDRRIVELECQLKAASVPRGIDPQDMANRIEHLRDEFNDFTKVREVIDKFSETLRLTMEWASDQERGAERERFSLQEKLLTREAIASINIDRNCHDVTSSEEDRQIGDQAIAHTQMNKCERGIMVALAKYPEGRSKKQIAVLAGYSQSGSFNAALAHLRQIEFIEGSGIMNATRSGIKALGHYSPLPTGRALADYWVSQLNTCEGQILQCVLRNPRGIAKDRIAAECKYSMSGSFNAALGKLRTLELIQRTNPIKPNEALL